MTNAEIEARLANIRERCDCCASSHDEDIPWLLKQLALARDLAAQREIQYVSGLLQLAEARKDSERLDWLEGERERELEYLNRHGPYIPALFRMNMPITRTAIDAAMGKATSSDAARDKGYSPMEKKP